MNQALKIIFVSALATAAVIKAAPALAEPVNGQNTSIVRTTDLDLSKADGRKSLDRRLVLAAIEVCGSASDADPAGKNQVRACRKDVLSAARAETRTMIASGTPSRTIVLAAAR
jgi:UrcA family protein